MDVIVAAMVLCCCRRRSSISFVIVRIDNYCYYKYYDGIIIGVIPTIQFNCDLSPQRNILLLSPVVSYDREINTSFYQSVSSAPVVSYGREIKTSKLNFINEYSYSYSYFDRSIRCTTLSVSVGFPSCLCSYSIIGRIIIGHYYWKYYFWKYYYYSNHPCLLWLIFTAKQIIVITRRVCLKYGSVSLSCRTVSFFLSLRVLLVLLRPPTPTPIPTNTTTCYSYFGSWNRHLMRRRC